MQDKETYTNLLTLVKSLTSLLSQASLEASNNNVFEVFHDAYNESVNLQHEVYKCMEKNGFYTKDQVPNDELLTVQNKFTESNY